MWLHYNLYSNTTVSFFVAYAMMGDALDLTVTEGGRTYESQDAFGRRWQTGLQLLI